MPSTEHRGTWRRVVVGIPPRGAFITVGQADNLRGIAARLAALIERVAVPALRMHRRRESGVR